MRYKYGYFTDKQFEDYKKQLHSKIHWLLIYKEQNYEKLDQYFYSVQLLISGLNQLIESPHLITLTSMLEAAKTEPDFSKYRKAILDAHSLIDRLPDLEEHEQSSS